LQCRDRTNKDIRYKRGIITSRIKIRIHINEQKHNVSSRRERVRIAQ